ncbi:MAG TPA: SDR family NAD(P)-dependent oxidoreductase, partial [Gemmatimonadaceae bacterium]
LALGFEGARVALVSRNKKQLEKVANEAGNDSFSIQCDVTNDSDIDRALGVIRKEFGGSPDIVVNNAGLFTIKTLDDTLTGEFDKILATNLRAPFRLIRELLPAMRERGSGDIVTIGSIADRNIFAGNAAYSATKYGQRALHEVLRAETRGTGVRATLISPAAVDTDIWDPIQYLGSDQNPDRSTMLSPESVSDAVLFAVTRPADVNIDELRLSRS